MCNTRDRDGVVHKDNHNRCKPSAARRREMRWWLLSPVSGFGGDGHTVPCWECGVTVTYHTLVMDRIHPGSLGGTYTRANIRPQCTSCSNAQSALLKRLFREHSGDFRAVTRAYHTHEAQGRIAREGR